MRPKAPVRAMVEIRDQKSTRAITNTTARHQKLSLSLRSKCARNRPFGPPLTPAQIEASENEDAGRQQIGIW